MAPKKETPAEDRQTWFGLLARAGLDDLEAAFASLAPPPRYRILRMPETGLMMVRGRTGGSGAPFNMGEMTVTRCSVEMEGLVGHGYVAGRAARHSELAAAFDALFQQDTVGKGPRAAILARLKTAEDRRRQSKARETEETRVEFFTLVRGEDD